MGSNTAITVLTRIISTTPRFAQVNMLLEDHDSESTWIRTHHFRKLDPPPHPHPDPIKVESWIRIRI